jgi:hypothetical protein
MTNDEMRLALLDQLKGVEKRVRADLLAQYRADPALMARAMERLRAEESSQADSKTWLETFAGRGAVLYILKSLYVRVLEDQRLLRPLRIRDGGTYPLFRQMFPRLGHAAYLRRIFDDAERALPDLFAPTPVEIATPGADAATAVWDVWQQAAAGGGPRFDFRGDLDTRFIGDLYQDLDPDVKARYALLQTPRFIEEFILDQTMEPALATFGLDDFRIVDPTCGSGHFLLGAFERLARRWRDRLGTGADATWQAARRALASVYGADLNEYACAMSRFRLLLAIVRETGVTDLDRLRTLHANVIVCDSLIPWERLPTEYLPGVADAWLVQYGTPDERERNSTFFQRTFHAVVGNPPYVSVFDKQKNATYRHAWPRSAKNKFSLSAPMLERFLSLPTSDGYCGLINAKNFCNAEFGKTVVENVLPRYQIDLVVDTSGASLPGHATPTILLFSRNKPPVGLDAPVQIVASRKGGPSDIADPRTGPVWSTIVRNYQKKDYQDAFISVYQLPQSTLIIHPWSFGAGHSRAILAKLRLYPTLIESGADAGTVVIMIENDAYVRRYARFLPQSPMISGPDIRDFRVNDLARTLCPLPVDSSEIRRLASLELWSLRATLGNRPTFKGIPFRNDPKKFWWQFAQVVESRINLPSPYITIGEINSNSQFSVTSGDIIFDQSAPIMTLKNATLEEHWFIAIVLSSSIFEFWFKSRCRIKNRWGEEWEYQYVRNVTNILQAPVLAEKDNPSAFFRLQQIVASLQRTLKEFELSLPTRIFCAPADDLSIETRIEVASEINRRAQRRLIALQEELDWTLYEFIGLLDLNLSKFDEMRELDRGQRPFEIDLATRVEQGETTTAWFERHSITSETHFPQQFAADFRRELEARLQTIRDDQTIRTLEQPEFKRRWNFKDWPSLLQGAAEEFLLDSLGTILSQSARAMTLDELVSALPADSASIVAYAKRPTEVTLSDTLGRLLAAESIPDNPAAFLTPAGLTKLIGTQTAAITAPDVPPAAETFAAGEAVDWKRIWRLQEREDADPSFRIADVPPPFVKTDYAHPNGWRIRGKFNIANERFVVYDDLTPKRYAWGGWTVAERARLSSEAFDLRGREPDGASMQPTLEDPRRCGIQFPLWDKLDELRRTNDPGYDDARDLANLCGRSCPCDVLDRWRESSTSKKRKKAPSKDGVATGISTPVATPDYVFEPATLERLLETIRPAGEKGLTTVELEPLFAGDRGALSAALELLRADGSIELIGRGRGRRFRIAQMRLLP